MLAGVSHDLRTILTRFKLEIALLATNDDMGPLKSDIDEMQLMLEDYMAFAKGGSGEETKAADVREIVEEIRDKSRRFGKPIELRFRRRKKSPVPLRRQNFKRAVANLVSNAARYADRVVITVTQDKDWLKVEVDDNGPGIPPAQRDIVFRPFFRIEKVGVGKATRGSASPSPETSPMCMAATSLARGQRLGWPGPSSRVPVYAQASMHAAARSVPSARARPAQQGHRPGIRKAER